MYTDIHIGDFMRNSLADCTKAYLVLTHENSFKVQPQRYSVTEESCYFRNNQQTSSFQAVPALKYKAAHIECIYVF